MSGQQPPQKQNTYQALRQNVGSGPGGRTDQRVVRLSKKPLKPGSELSVQERTFLDRQTGEVITQKESDIPTLSCGCSAYGPADVRSICPECASLSWRGTMRHPRYICNTVHKICIRCRQRRIRAANGGGIVWRFLKGILKLCLWPAFDVEE